MTKNSRILLCLLTLIFGIIFAHKASALSGSTYINKAYLEGVYTCWTGHLKNAPITQNDFPVFSGNFPDRIFKDNNDGTVLIPRVLSGLDENDLGCVDLMAGSGGSFGGVVSMSGVTQPKNDSAPSEKTAFMKNIGYSTEKTTSSTGKCASFNFKANSGNRETRSGSLCLTDLTNDEKITSNTKVEISDDSGGGNFTLQDMIMFKPINGGVTVSYDTYSENCTQTNLGKTCSGYVKRRVSEEFKVADYSTFDSFMSGTDGVAGLFNSQPPSLCAGYYQLACTDYTLDITKSDSIYNPSTMDESMVQYVVEDETVAANTAIKYFSGSEELKDWASLKYTDAEKAHLYQDYINKVFEASFADNSCPSLSDSQAALLEDSGYSKVKWNFNSGGAKTCYVKASEKTANKEVVGIEENGHFGRKMKFGDLITALDSITLADGEFDDVTDGETTTNEDTDPCYNAGIEGMSWILCPVINNTTNAVDGIEKILRDWLSIDVNQVFIDQTYSAWTTFRDIANGLLVIVLLIIIFSQLTGVGIDNYGIKKMLPKVVVMAILINLSYIICELAVDLSNILGIGLNNLFEAVGQNIRQGAGAGEETLAGIVAGLFGALAGAGAVAGTAITAISIAGGGGVMLVISLILVLLIALVAVLMFFVMLGARMMIVIMFTVIAPVAFLLYILPNTQALFKKWWKVFQAALVVFPICGALYGLSFVIKAIIFNGGEISFILALIAVCAPFMPFLLIPTLLKSALAGLGIIGGALTMMGNGLKRGISSADSSIKNTNTYKEQQNENARRLQERRANRIVDRLNSRRRNGELSTRDQRRLARNYETLDKLTREDNAARTIMAEQEFKGMTESDIQREWEEAFNAGNTQRLDAVTNVLNARYGTGAANWMAKTLAGKNIAGEGEEQKKMQASMRALQDNMAHNNTFANNMKNKASDAYQMISNGGLLGHDENGKDVFANLDHYSKNNAISKDVKDWSTQSADTLRRAISSGALEDDTIRQLLDSTDPAIQSGIQSDKSKRDVLQAYLDGMETNPSGVGPSLPEKEAAQRYRDRRQQALDQARNTNEQQRQELVDTLREINENLRQHNQGDTFNGDGDGI